jgi:O-antigen/teichoic acid export membrane protein
MGLLVLVNLLGILDFSFYVWNLALITFLVLTSIFIHLAAIKDSKLNNQQEFKDVYKFGGLISVAGPLLVLITASTRIYIEYFLTKEIVGLYSYFFRIASVALIFSRVFIILMYRKLFTSNHEDLDSKFSKLIYLIFLLNGAIFFLAPFMLSQILPVFGENWEENKSLFLLCLFQIVFWVTSSLFEPLIQRENKLKGFILILLLCNILLLALLFINDFFNYSS